MASTTSFPADAVPQAPEDPLFGLMAAFKADQDPNKIDLVRFSVPEIPSQRRSRQRSPYLLPSDPANLSPGNWCLP